MKRNKKREKFFEVCLKLIHEKGFKATTMRDIAKEMDFEVANVYNYIPAGKYQLLNSYLDDLADEFHIGIDDIIASDYSTSEQLRAVISLHVKITANKPLQIGLLNDEWRNLKPKELERFLQRRKGYEEKVKSIIAAGIKKNEIKKDIAPEVAMLTLLSSVRWLYNWYSSDSTAKSISPIEMERQIVELIMRGLAIP